MKPESDCYSVDRLVSELRMPERQQLQLSGQRPETSSSGQLGWINDWLQLGFLSVLSISGSDA